MLSRSDTGRHQRVIFAGMISLGVLSLAGPSRSDERDHPRFPWEPSAKVDVPEHRDIADGQIAISEVIKRGEALFSARFTVDDGFGRPGATGDSKPTIRVDQDYPLLSRTAGPDANSCAGCHNQPKVGGSGDFATNVFVGAHFTDPPTMSVSPEVTNERNTNSIFGAGVVELVAREITKDLQKLRENAIDLARSEQMPVTVKLVSKGINYGELIALPDGSTDTDGVKGIDLDLVVKPFGYKGIAVSLREFTNFALNQHHGIESTERFGWTRTGIRDFDSDGVSDEFNTGQVTALVLFQASLPAPVRLSPKNSHDEILQKRGEQVFVGVGCNDCHRTTLPLHSNVFSEPNPYNRWGNLHVDDRQGIVSFPIDVSGSNLIERLPDGSFEVSIFTDFKRHKVCDEDIPHFCNERRRQDFVATDEFLSTKLWDAGTSAPYGHRGDLTTISEAIYDHGGEARSQRDAFLNLPLDDKKSLIFYLRSLTVCADLACAGPDH
jgi:hypothetical protein